MVLSFFPKYHPSVRSDPFQKETPFSNDIFFFCDGQELYKCGVLFQKKTVMDPSPPGLLDTLRTPRSRLRRQLANLNEYKCGVYRSKIVGWTQTPSHPANPAVFPCSPCLLLPSDLAPPQVVGGGEAHGAHQGKGALSVCEKPQRGTAGSRIREPRAARALSP